MFRPSRHGASSAPTLVSSDHVVSPRKRPFEMPHVLDAESLDAGVQPESWKHIQPRIHPGVRRVLTYLDQHELDRSNASLKRLAQIAALSPSRLMHVFTISLGIPLRPYVSWLRVQRAAWAIASGHTVTEAAHSACFADAPHLTRTFRRTLGITPRGLARRLTTTVRS
jgi:AraC-like DNA-binding protein